MELSLTANHLSAVCIDHVLPTATGAHVHTEPISARNDDPRVRHLAGLPGRAGHIYLSFGPEIDAALAIGTDRPGAARGQAVMFQFLRGVPAEAADRVVLRLLEPGGLTLGQVAARADRAGLPIEIHRAGLLPPRPGEPPVDPARLIGLTAEMELTTIADGEILWVAPLRHWAPDAYAEAGPDVLSAALAGPYPLARMVFDGDHGVRLGMPAALAEHVHGGALAGSRRPLDAGDLPKTGGQRATGYGDLLAAMAKPGSRAFVTVESASSGAGSVFLAVHDGSGLSFLDPATGGAAVFPADPSRIELYPVAGEPDLTDWLAAIFAHRPGGAPRRRISHSSRVRAIPLGDGTRTLDVIGDAGVLTGRFLTEITGAAEAVDSPVVLIATDRPSTAPTEGQLFDLEWLLFQHRQNQLAGGATPIVVVRGDAPAAITDLLAGYDFAVVQQSSTSPGRTGGGFTLHLDNLWTGRDAAGNPVSAPVRTLTGDFLRAVGAVRPGRRPGTVTEPVDERLMTFLTTPLEDVPALRSVLAGQGSALRTLAPEIGRLGAVRKDLFAGWEAILRIDGRGDEVLSAAAFDYLGRRSLSFVPSLLEKDPETRGGDMADLIDLTKGPLDDGASRAILGAIKQGLEGGPLADIRQRIHQHSVYLPRNGRTGWIRELREMTRRSPEHSALFEQIAVFVETCP